MLQSEKEKHFENCLPVYKQKMLTHNCARKVGSYVQTIHQVTPSDSSTERKAASEDDDTEQGIVPEECQHDHEQPWYEHAHHGKEFSNGNDRPAAFPDPFVRQVARCDCYQVLS